LDDAIILEGCQKDRSPIVSFLTNCSVPPHRCHRQQKACLWLYTSVPNMESLSLEESLLSTCFLVFAVLDLLHQPPVRGSGKHVPSLFA
jgi:hypothetical protein